MHDQVEPNQHLVKDGSNDGKSMIFTYLLNFTIHHQQINLYVTLLHNNIVK